MSILFPPVRCSSENPGELSSTIHAKTFLFLFVMISLFFLAVFDDNQISSKQYNQLYQLGKSDPVVKRKVEKARIGNGIITHYEYNEIIQELKK